MKPKVLVFDDEEIFIHLIKHILIKKDIEVIGRQNCNDIISYIKDIRPDVILMDNKIPPKGGVNATRLIKEDEGIKDIPVIYFSAHDKIEELAEEAGADDFFAKPFDIREFEEIVLKYIDINKIKA